MREIIETASSPDRRLLTKAGFLKRFDELTSVQISAERAQLLERIYDQALGSFAVGSQSALTILPATTIADAHLDFLALPRNGVLDNFQSSLNRHGVLNLYGSTGMGKSTAAKQLIARDAERHWNWIPQSASATELQRLLRDMAIAVQKAQTPFGVVLDDLDCAPTEFAKIKTALASLLRAVRQSGARLVITSNKALPPTFCIQLDVADNSLVCSPLLTHEEIADLARLNGCAEEQCAKLGRIAEIKTGGHPQLAHAMVMGLRAKGWPSASEIDLFEQTPDVEAVREEALARIANELPAPQKLLLYRLSALTGSFRRSVITHLTFHPEKIGESGDIATGLIGPWIEPAEHGRFRLSPLLRDSAEKMLGRSEVPAIHQAIAAHMLEFRELSFNEGGALLLHAFLGKSERELLAVAYSFGRVPRKVWPTLATQISWLAFVHSDSGKPLFEDNAATNFLLRKLQFRVALQEHPDRLETIAKFWEAETALFEDEHQAKLSRLLICVDSLIHVEFGISGSKIIKLLEKIDSLLRDTQAAGLFLPELEKDHWEHSAGSSDPIAVMFALNLVRITDRSALEDMLEALETCETGLRARLLTIFESSDARASLFVDRAWISQDKATVPDWEGSLKLLDRISNRFAGWGVLSIVQTAEKAKAVIHDEYLNNAPTALEILDAIETKHPASVQLQDARATIYLRQGRYQEALALWSGIFPLWKRERWINDTRQMIARRKSGIAAAAVSKWETAAEHFCEAGKFAEADSKLWSALGFLADSAYCDWRAGKRQQALRGFIQTLQRAVITGDSQSDPQSFVFRKFFGHIVLRVLQENRQGEPGTMLEQIQPGMCSNPDVHPEINKLPDSPFDITWLHLAELEFLTSGKFELVNEFIPDLGSSPFPIARLMWEQLQVRVQLTLNMLDNLHEAIKRAEVAGCAAKRHHLAGRKIWDVEPIGGHPISVGDPNYLYIGTSPYVCAIVSAACHKMNLMHLLDVWSGHVPTGLTEEQWHEWLQRARQAFLAPVQTLIALMEDASDSTDRRPIAAILILAGREAPPDSLLYAGVMLWAHFHKIIWGPGIARQFCQLVANSWLTAIKTPSILRTPRLTVPLIQAACTSSAKPAGKIPAILVAAGGATTLRIPNELTREMERAAKSVPLG